MMRDLTRIADQLLNRPLLVTPDKAGIILAVLGGRIGLGQGEVSRFEGSSYIEEEPGRMRGRPYNVTPDGVAIITITGSLVSRGAWIGASSGLTSYEGIQHQLKTAMRDDRVRSVVLDLHTPGGQALGCFETAAMVRELASRKRTVAVVNGMAASGGYAIASGASEIVSTEIGVSGSVGVLYVHADYSRALENEGVKPTIFIAGAHKADGNPFQPLSEQVSADMQREVNSLYEVFLETVALGRGGRLSVEEARATQARAPMGREAVAMKLADRIGTFESVLVELSRASSKSASGRSTLVKGKAMEHETDAPAVSTEAGISKADLDKAVADAVARGLEDGRKAEAARLAGIEANLVPGYEAQIAAHKADPAMTPEKSALAIIAAIKANPADPRVTLQKLDKAAEGVESRPSQTGDGGETKTAATTPEGWKAEWEASADLKAEYPTADAYVATKKREARS